jgi:hypothetical protein
MYTNLPDSKGTSKVYTHIHLLCEETSTFHHDYIVIDQTTAAAEAESITRDADTSSEQEWRKIVSTPSVRTGLRRLAAEARRQIAAKETEEGGFAIE